MYLGIGPIGPWPRGSRIGGAASPGEFWADPLVAHDLYGTAATALINEGQGLGVKTYGLTRRSRSYWA